MSRPLFILFTLNVSLVFPLWEEHHWHSQRNSTFIETSQLAVTPTRKVIKNYKIRYKMYNLKAVIKIQKAYISDVIAANYVW